MPRPLDRYEDLKRIFSQMGSTADIDDLGFARVDETNVELLLVALDEIAVLVFGRCDELQLLSCDDLVGHEADAIGARLAKLRLRALRVFVHEVAAFFVSTQVVVLVLHVERDGDALAHVGVEGDDRLRDVGSLDLA